MITRTTADYKTMLKMVKALEVLDLYYTLKKGCHTEWHLTGITTCDEWIFEIPDASDEDTVEEETIEQDAPTV